MDYLYLSFQYVSPHQDWPLCMIARKIAILSNCQAIDVRNEDVLKYQVEKEYE